MLSILKRLMRFSYGSLSYVVVLWKSRMNIMRLVRDFCLYRRAPRSCVIAGEPLGVHAIDICVRKSLQLTNGRRMKLRDIVSSTIRQCAS